MDAYKKGKSYNKTFSAWLEMMWADGWLPRRLEEFMHAEREAVIEARLSYKPRTLGVFSGN